MILISLLDGLTGRALIVKLVPGGRQGDFEDVEETGDAVLDPVEEHDREQAPAEEEDPEQRDHVYGDQEEDAYRQHVAMVAAGDPRRNSASAGCWDRRASWRCGSRRW
jgi:hypothetical protein